MSIRWAAYAAYVNSVAALAQLLSSGGDPTANGAAGLVNNLSGVIWAASFVPVAYLFYRASRTHANIVSAAAFAFGLFTFGASAFLELLTATGQLTFDQETLAYYPVLGGIGVWLVMAGAVALMETTLPRAPIIFGAVIGGFWFLANVLFGAGGLPSPTADGPTNDLTDSGILLLETGFLLQPFWGLWLGRALRAPPKPAAPARP